MSPRRLPTDAQLTAATVARQVRKAVLEGIAKGKSRGSQFFLRLLSHGEISPIESQILASTRIRISTVRRAQAPAKGWVLEWKTDAMPVTAYEAYPTKRAALKQQEQLRGRAIPVVYGKVLIRSGQLVQAGEDLIAYPATRRSARRGVTRNPAGPSARGRR